MSVIKRPIYGPVGEVERTGAQIRRHVRSPAEAFRDFMAGPGTGFVLASAGACVAVEPAAVLPVLPVALVTAYLSLRRPLVLPLRLPASAQRLDHHDPAPGSRKPQVAAGIFYLGIDHETGQELWLTNDDARQHVSVPGVTGAGKTDEILGFMANSLAFGSGFVFVDGKGDAELYAKAYALARTFGREKDVRVLNFMVASGDRDSNTLNPFAWATADALAEMLRSQIEASPGGGGDNRIFSQRAGTLLGALAPVLVWMRNRHGLPIDIDAIRFATELQSIASLAFDRMFRRFTPETGQIDTIPVPDMPEEMITPLRSYLGDTGGYDTAIHRQQRQSDEPAKQHSFVTMHFGATFTQLSVSLGHIFRTQISDIDMRDVILNRRILVVRLPALENSGETTLALGKLTITTLRNMMAQALGGALEGKVADIIENRASTSLTPMPIAMDELAAYVPAGAAAMLQQGRGIGTMFVLGWHDVEGLEAQIGARAFTLLNNANTQVIMRQNAGRQTREHLERSMGDTDVTQVSSFQTGDLGYRAALSANVQRTTAMDWRDPRGLVAGEAIIVHANVRCHARLFHHGVSLRSAETIRLNRPMAVPLGDMRDGPSQRTRIERLRATLAAPPDLDDAPPGPHLAVLLDAFRASRDGGHDAGAAAMVAIDALGAVLDERNLPVVPPEPGAPGATEFTPTLDHIARRPRDEDAEQATTSAVGREAAAMLDELAEIERAGGLDPDAARRAAARAAAARDEARDAATLPRPPAMTAERLRAVLAALVEDLKA